MTHPQVPDETVVLRRGRATVVYLVVFLVLVVALTVPTVAAGSSVMLPVAGGCAVLTVLGTLVVLRARTRLTAAGIENRTLGGTELVAWADVARVLRRPAAGGVLVVRRDGRTMRLAGVLGATPRNGWHVARVVAHAEAEIARHAPAVADNPPVPAVIVRRLRWRPMLRPMLALGVATLGVGVSGIVLWPLLVAAAALLVLAGFLVLATARGRTVIGPDGVRNRAVRAETFVAWSAVCGVTGYESAPRVVRLLRRDGRPMVLAAVRDGDPAPDGLTFDDIVAVVRDRAHLGAGPEADAAPDDATPARPLSLRPSRLPVLWMVPVAAAAVAGMVMLPPELLFVGGYLLMVPVLLLLTAAKLLRGRTEAGPDGVRNRLLGRATVTPWEQVDRLIVAPTLFGRTVKLVCGRKRVGLAAPRTGLLARDPDFDATVAGLRALARPRQVAVETLSVRAVRVTITVALVVVAAMAVVIGKPWASPWWPTRHEAAALPPACSVTAAAGAARWLPHHRVARSTRDDYRYFVVSHCSWAAEHASIDVDLKLERRVGGTGGTEQARETFADYVDLGYRDRVRGIGDECRQRTETGGSTVAVLVRRANVTVEVRYYGRHVRHDLLVARARTVARAAVARVHVD